MMREGRCLVNLTLTDVYNDEIPDQDMETCLKVLRSIRNAALWPNFNAEAAVLLSHTHAHLVNLIEQIQKWEQVDASIEEQAEDGTDEEA